MAFRAARMRVLNGGRTLADNEVLKSPGCGKCEVERNEEEEETEHCTTREKGKR